MTAGLYDLLAAGVSHDDVAAWLGGAEVDGLPPTSPAERQALREAWWFWARPGQHWSPGPEFITAHVGGRGSGKSWAARSAIFDAALTPDRWGGHALIAGPAPDAVDSDMLHGLSGIVSTGRHLADAGILPQFIYNPSKNRITFRHPRGGGEGLTVMIRASSNPKGARGPNVGLAWCDEVGVWWHRKCDEQGTNFWRAMRPSVRAGNPDSKIIVTMTPSRAAEVRRMNADAERPECPACREAWLRDNGGRYQGEPLREPWRLPRSPQRVLFTGLNTRTTEATRECPACGGPVVAEVRTVFFDTRDNPHTDEASRSRAGAELAGGTSAARREYAPRGEEDDLAEGALVRYDDVRQVDVSLPQCEDEAVRAARAPAPDRWTLALAALGADEVVVDVDPAVTASDSSDETGVVAACLRRVTPAVGASAAADDPGLPEREQVVGLQDWSVRPDEVQAAGGGAPSLVWAPRAFTLAVLWGARRIIVEVNQGGEEVLSAVRDLCRVGLTDAAAEALAREHYPGMSPARLGLLSRRLASSSRGIVVESKHRRADKPARLEWYGRVAALGGQAVALIPWLGGPRHWAVCLSQGTDYEPPREGAPRTRERKDRFDALCSASQVLHRVVETRVGDGSEVSAPGWMGRL